MAWFRVSRITKWSFTHCCTSAIYQPKVRAKGPWMSQSSKTLWLRTIDPPSIWLWLCSSRNYIITKGLGTRVIAVILLGNLLERFSWSKEESMIRHCEFLEMARREQGTIMYASSLPWYFKFFCASFHAGGANVNVLLS